LSLSNRLTHDAHLLDGITAEARLALNYGWNKIRFPSPLPVDARVRGSIAIKAVNEVSGDGVEVVKEIVIGIEHQDKPCFVGESVSRFYF
jgi:acyl dehydratase